MATSSANNSVFKGFFEKQKLTGPNFIETGHWKRNCPQYLAELLKKKKNATSGAGGS
ncbi:hypothetical protein Tco_0521237, partial [Tanacetum coccineum]